MAQEVQLKAKDKLLWLGLKRAAQSLSDIKAEIDRLRNTVGDFTTFQDALQNGYDLDGDGTKEAIDSYADFKTYLKDNGWTQSEVDKFVEKIKNNYTDDDNSGSTFDEFKDYVLNDADSYTDIKNTFNSSTTLGSDTQSQDGGKVAGISFYENPGVTKDGISVPAGATEVFGTEIHFSKSAPPASSVEGDGSNFSVSNISTDDSDNVVNVYSSITISADVSNSSGQVQFFSANLKEDGETVQSNTIQIDPNSTKTVSFTVSKTEYVCHDYAINSSGTVTVCWAPSGLLIT